MYFCEAVAESTTTSGRHHRTQSNKKKNTIPVATPIYSPGYIVPEYHTSQNKEWTSNRMKYLEFVVYESLMIAKYIHWGEIANHLNQETNGLFFAQDCKVKYLESYNRNKNNANL